ncbi:MAG TPA: 3-phosphoserine/phosphohydroxythreonine transaminase, partial [Anaerolineales bacterium]|nr:3-phosphoserine/phosphohydroxythreonine transaminase [Anaerolineales bacterium]
MKASRVYNFSAGPGTLPLPVLQRAQDELLGLPGLGMSVLEISHRSEPFERIMSSAQNNLRALLDLPRDYHILFLQGGATLQFSMVPMNLLRGTGKRADYVVAGTWGKKAVTEARREGEVRVLWDGETEEFTRMPRRDEWQPDSEAAYVHITSNETIQGLQLQWEPESAPAPLVCDLSSDFLSRPIEAEHYALIYAGAQKNAGPAGVTVVIVREDLLERVPSGLHTLLDYGVHAAQDSMHNTPPVFSIYMVNLVTEWLLQEIGGVGKMGGLYVERAGRRSRAIGGSEGVLRG